MRRVQVVAEGCLQSFRRGKWKKYFLCWKLCFLVRLGSSTDLQRGMPQGSYLGDGKGQRSANGHKKPRRGGVRHSILLHLTEKALAIT